MIRLLILAAVITTGVVIALSLVWRREPRYATTYLEDEDGVAPFDPYVVATWTGA